jgi:transcriptional regulator with XRE-family HTH domain
VHRPGPTKENEAAPHSAAARRNGAGAVSPPASPEGLGAKLRTEREARGLTLRELARRIGVSPSLVSQIERGLVMPSVGTLWSMATELGLVMDQLFKSDEHKTRSTEQELSRTPEPTARDPVQRRDDRKRIRLATGVVWERLTAQPDDEVEFLCVSYEAGAESCPEDSLFRHGGREYAYILSGRLGVQIGFEKYELGPGDSVSFSSLIPHRLWAIGGEPAVAIWTVVNRRDDVRRDR